MHAIRAKGFQVELANGQLLEVGVHQIAERLKLPWKPVSLRDYLIILRRRNASREEYVEDLRVRRNYIRQLLRLLTKMGEWREDQGTEPLHQYYVGFDFMSDEELTECFPEDGIPDDLNIQEVDTEEWATEFTAETFQDWLYEGRHNCEVAQALLHAWTRNNLRSSDNETIYDFYHGLLHELNLTCAKRTLPVAALARFVLEHCSLPFQLNAEHGEDQITEVAERISEEAATVSAYLHVWKATGTTETAPTETRANRAGAASR